MRTYKITKGQQYDEQGATVKHGRSLYARYDREGKFDSGDPVPAYDRGEVDMKVEAVISSGQEQTLSLGEAEPQMLQNEIDKLQQLEARMAEWERTDI